VPAYLDTYKGSHKKAVRHVSCRTGTPNEREISIFATKQRKHEEVARFALEWSTRVPVLIIASADDVIAIYNAVKAEFQKQARAAVESSATRDMSEFMYAEKCYQVGFVRVQDDPSGQYYVEDFVQEFKDENSARTFEVKNNVTLRPEFENGPTDRYRITITEGEFGGRGHDYEVKDYPANKVEENGGLMVVATAIPKDR